MGGCLIVNTIPFTILGGSKLTSLQLIHQRDGEEQPITLSPSLSHSKKQSLDWLKGLRKVFTASLYTPSDRPVLY